MLAHCLIGNRGQTSGDSLFKRFYPVREALDPKFDFENDTPEGRHQIAERFREFIENVRTCKSSSDIWDHCSARSLSDCRRALTSSGTLILNSGTGAHGIGMLVRLVKPLVLSPFVRQNLRQYLSVPNHEDLVILKEFVESGRLTPVSDRKYLLHETCATLGYIEGGHARRKVVVSL